MTIFEETKKRLDDALEHAQSKKTRYQLRKVLGEDVIYDEVNGHLFKRNVDPDKAGIGSWCQVAGCEMSSKELAKDYKCPINVEGYDMDPRCGNNEEF